MARLSHVPPQSLGAPVVRGIPQPTIPAAPYNAFLPLGESLAGRWTGASDAENVLPVGASEPDGGYIVYPNGTNLELRKILADGTLSGVLSTKAILTPTEVGGRDRARVFSIGSRVFVLHCTATPGNASGVEYWAAYRVNEDETISFISGSTGTATFGFSTRTNSVFHAGTGCRIGPNKVALFIVNVPYSGSYYLNELYYRSFVWTGASLLTFRTEAVSTYGTSATPYIYYPQLRRLNGTNSFVLSYSFYGSIASTRIMRVTVANDGTMTAVDYPMPSGVSAGDPLHILPLGVAGDRFAVMVSGGIRVVDAAMTTLTTLLTSGVLPGTSASTAWTMIPLNDREFFLAVRDTDGTYRRHLVTRNPVDDTLSFQAAGKTFVSATITGNVHGHTNATQVTPDLLWITQEVSGVTNLATFAVQGD